MAKPTDVRDSTYRRYYFLSLILVTHTEDLQEQRNAEFQIMNFKLQSANIVVCIYKMSRIGLLPNNQCPAMFHSAKVSVLTLP